MLGELAAQRAGAAAVTTARAALLAESKAARDPNPDLEAARLADVLHAAFEAGHAAALELYKDPPPKYCYPSVLRSARLESSRTHSERRMTAPVFGRTHCPRLPCMGRLLFLLSLACCALPYLDFQYQSH